MAKQKVNKTKAVKDYLKTHRGAMSSEIAKALAKQGIKINPGHVANIKSSLKRKRVARKAKAAKLVAAVPAISTAAVVAAAEAPAKTTNAITLEQIKAVSQMVKSIGGFCHLHEMLSVIKEVGGLKKFKDLLDAMAVNEIKE
jgi:hypothetical protein